MKHIFLRVVKILLFRIIPPVFVLVFFASTVSKLNSYSERLGILERKLGSKSDSVSADGEGGVLGQTTKTDTATLRIEHERDNESLKESTRQSSPDGKSYAYLQHKFIKDIREIGDGDYTYVEAYYDWQEQPVFKSDFRVSSFEWVNEEELAVYRDCGTECTIAYIVNIKTKKYRELPMGVGYTWSPNKKYVATYHYSYKYGITVFEKDDTYGRIMFELRREHSPDGSGLIDETKLVWSPDSAKLAMIIEKEGEEKLEMIVFSVVDHFSMVSRADLEEKKFSNLHWKNEKTVLFEDGAKLKVVSL